MSTDTAFTKSDRLTEVSVYYKEFSNIVTVRTVAAEYLVAMKLMSGRLYKNDLSDIAGILWEHQKRDEPLTEEIVDSAVSKLYGGWADIPTTSREFFQSTFENGDYEAIYIEALENEHAAKRALLDFEEQHPNALDEDNINSIIKQAKRKKETDAMTLKEERVALTFGHTQTSNERL